MESGPHKQIHPAVSCGDFERLVQLKKEQALVDQGKYHLLTSHFHPNSSYHFPSVLYGGQHRSFQHCWLKHYNGIMVHSETDQGGHCKYCVLFGQAPHSVFKLPGILVTQPLKHLQNASEKFREHILGIGNSAPHVYHLAANEAATAFIATMKRKQLPLNQQLSLIMARTVEESRKS